MRCIDKDFVRGSIFHVYNHVIDDYDLFYDDSDYEFMINIFEDNIKKIPGSIYAYCLMPDHYHVLIRQDSEKAIYRFFNYSFIRYAIYYNKKYCRKGPIFRSPLQHKIVSNEIYLLQLCKYIHMNPVRKDLVISPDEWPYSNYQNWINNEKSKLSSPEVHTRFCPSPENYIKYIESYSNFLSKKDFWDLTFRRY